MKKQFHTVRSSNPFKTLHKEALIEIKELSNAKPVSPIWMYKDGEFMIFDSQLHFEIFNDLTKEK